MKESISFPEEKIPQVIAVIRRGLKTEKSREIKRGLEMQCKELENYWKEMQKEE